MKLQSPIFALRAFGRCAGMLAVAAGITLTAGVAAAGSDHSQQVCYAGCGSKPGYFINRWLKEQERSSEEHKVAATHRRAPAGQ